MPFLQLCTVCGRTTMLAPALRLEGLKCQVLAGGIMDSRLVAVAQNEILAWRQAKSPKCKFCCFGARGMSARTRVTIGTDVSLEILYYILVILEDFCTFEFLQGWMSLSPENAVSLLAKVLVRWYNTYICGELGVYLHANYKIINFRYIIVICSETRLIYHLHIGRRTTCMSI